MCLGPPPHVDKLAKLHTEGNPFTTSRKEALQLGFDASVRDGCRLELPLGWVAGDDEMGRCSAFRAELRQRHERCMSWMFHATR